MPPVHLCIAYEMATVSMYLVVLTLPLHQCAAYGDGNVSTAYSPMHRLWKWQQCQYTWLYWHCLSTSALHMDMATMSLYLVVLTLRVRLHMHMEMTTMLVYLVVLTLPIHLCTDCIGAIYTPQKIQVEHRIVHLHWAVPGWKQACSSWLGVRLSLARISLYIICCLERRVMIWRHSRQMTHLERWCRKPADSRLVQIANVNATACAQPKLNRAMPSLDFSINGPIMEMTTMLV